MSDPRITDAAVEAAEHEYEAFGATMRDALEAAYPAIRQQVAEEIAVAMESLAHDQFADGEYISSDRAAAIAREIGGRA